MRLRGVMRVMGPMGPMGLMGLIGLIGLIGLLGCSADDEAGSRETPIVFTGDRQAEEQVTRGNANATRAVTPLYELEKTFTVYGAKNGDYNAATGSYASYQTVFQGYTVRWLNNSVATTTTNSRGWEYVNQQLPGALEQTVKFWDYSADAYRFMAVTGSGVTPTTTTADGVTVSRLTFEANATNPETMPYYSHLWFSNNKNDYGKPVTLVFVKPLCRVRFMFTFENPADAADTELSGKSLARSDGKNIMTGGKVYVDYPLTGTATAETLSIDDNASGLSELTKDYYTVEDPKETDENLIAGKEYWYTLLPAPDGQGTLTLTVSVNGDPKTTVVPKEYTKWLPGYEYTYIFKVHVDGGVSIDKVQSAFTDWIEHVGSHEIYNW